MIHCTLTFFLKFVFKMVLGFSTFGIDADKKTHYKYVIDDDVFNTVFNHCTLMTFCKTICEKVSS
jgi:hypothetical protein